MAPQQQILTSPQLQVCRESVASTVALLSLASIAALQAKLYCSAAWHYHCSSNGAACCTDLVVLFQASD